jgi:hypothetical protein
VLLARRETATKFICEMPGSPPGILRFVIMGLVEISKKLKRQIGFEPQLWLKRGSIFRLPL